jgi:hypothetical protein
VGWATLFPRKIVMLELDSRFAPNASDIAAKVIDGEAIIMNLSNGLYFSMDKVGALIWESVEAGHSVQEIGDLVQGRFAVDPETAQADVARLLEELLAEDLVQTKDGEGSGEPVDFNGEPRADYIPPVLNKYSDMADLLALDPPMPGLGDPQA